MIGISRLYCGKTEDSDHLRYGRDLKTKKPVVVWNVTPRCNLDCIHCYAVSDNRREDAELTTAEAKTLIDDLSSFGVPVVLFSGGEPLLRDDILDIIGYASAHNIRTVLSTNGTLINRETARKLKAAGLGYAGISLDGTEPTHDTFRQSKGSFQKALAGIRACQEVGLKTGIRFTITRNNFQEIEAIFDIVEKEEIPRLCFYHLVYSGRGTKLIQQDLNHQETRRVIDLIITRTKMLCNKNPCVEVLTVDNHTDSVYLYLRMKQEGHPDTLCQEVYKLLKQSGGNNAGQGIACIGWDGDVHPDQFWRHYSLGNIRQRPFSEIWSDTNEPLMARLRDKNRYVKGRCATCAWLEVCAGNSRVRAEAVTNDPWAPDPACYLTDEEIKNRKVKR